MAVKLMHKRSELKKFEEDVEDQMKMNLAFIKKLPKISETSMRELGRQTEEGIVPEVISPEKIKRYRRGLGRAQSRG